MSLIAETQPVIDPRSDISKLRRTFLQQILTAEGIPYDPDGPADALRLVIEGKGIDFYKYVHNPHLLKPKVYEGEVVEKTSSVPLGEMKRPQLMTLCKQRGLPVSVKDKASDLIERLRNGSD